MTLSKTLTVELPHRTDTWELTAKCRTIARAIAKKLQVTTEELLTGLSSGRIKRGGGPIESEQVPKGFQITLPNDDTLRMRVTRAAEISEQTIEQFVWCAVASDVEMYEESRLFAANGSLIGDVLPLQEFRSIRMKDRKLAGYEVLNEVRG